MKEAGLFHVTFRVDSSADIGVGHVMRCLTLARSLQTMGCECVFVGQDLTEKCVDLVVGSEIELILLDTKESDELCDALACLEIVSCRNTDWIIVDHYGLGFRWEESLRSHGFRVMAFEDEPGRFHNVDMLLDPTIGRVGSDYKNYVADQFVCLAGTQYALIGSEFRNQRESALTRRRKSVVEIPNLLVSLGGGDTSETVLEVLAAIADVEGTYPVSTTLVLGGPQSRDSDIRAAAQKLCRPATVIGHTTEMANVMASADLAIGAAGGSSWERCCLGLPTVVMSLAENQEQIASLLAETGAALKVSPLAEEVKAALIKLLTCQQQFSDLSSKAADLCDGLGVKRVRASIAYPLVSIHPASMDNAEFIWQARNGDDAVAQYRSPVLPGYEDHIAWLATALEDVSRKLWIVKLAGKAIAHVRLDGSSIDSSTAELSFYLLPQYRAKGLGLIVLNSVTQQAFASGYETMNAEVKLTNIGSLRTFEDSGYSRGDVSQEGFISFQKRDTKDSKMSYTI